LESDRLALNSVGIRGCAPRLSPLQIDEYSLVSFIPLDLTKEESIAFLLQHVDGAIQYGEDADVRTSSALDA
jgi:hypothetical protein